MLRMILVNPRAGGFGLVLAQIRFIEVLIELEPMSEIFFGNRFDEAFHVPVLASLDLSIVIGVLFQGTDNREHARDLLGQRATTLPIDGLQRGS